jgi:hypothetical protein
MIITFTGSCKVGNVASNALNDIATAAQAGIRHSPPVFPSLKLVVFRGAGN